MKVLCIGCSITEGFMGHTYVDYISEKYDVINKGKSGWGLGVLMQLYEPCDVCVLQLPHFSRQPQEAEGTLDEYTIWHGADVRLLSKEEQRILIDRDFKRVERFNA